MKIGLLSGEYPPRQGGVGDFTRELARALIAAGHEVQVITGCSGQPHRGAARDTGSTRQEDGIVVQHAISSWGTRCWGQLADVVRQNQLEVLNIQYEPAAYDMQVGVNFLPSAWVRRQLRVPLVTTFHDLLVPYLFPKAGPLRWKVVEYLARRSAAVIVTNEADRARLSNLQPLISNLYLIPIGSNIDPNLAAGTDQAAVRARWGFQPDELVLGYFGFLNLSKGGSDLMQALKILSDDGLPVKLLLIGGRTGSSDPSNAEYAAQVDRLIEALGVTEHVKVTGYLTAADVSRALRVCDMMVLPYVDGASPRRGSLLAAIAHGRAIITTEPRYPIEGVTPDRAAVFVPVCDPQALAKAIRRVHSDPALHARLESGAAEAAKLYTWHHIAAQTLVVFAATVASRKARPS